MAVKKTAKKAAKKSPAKKTAAKKSPAKKAVAKKKTPKKAVAKKAVAKKTAKKAPAKKAATKRVVKKSAKKAPAKRVAKKATATRVSSAPAAVVAAPVKPVAPVAPKPVAAPKASTSNRTAWIVVLGIAVLVAILWTTSTGSSDDDAAPMPTMSESAEPSASAEPSEAPIAVVEAPTKFVALKSEDGLKLRWVAPMAVEGLTGYNVEIRAAGTTEWTVIATVPADQLTQNVTKISDSGGTQFRVSSVYSDGQTASAKIFGFAGEFK